MLHSLQALQTAALQHRDALVIVAAAFLTIAVAFWASVSRKRYFVLQRSNESELLVYELGRIAAALERLAARDEVPSLISQEILPDDPRDPAPLGHAGVGSMFGFGRRADLPDPMYRSR